MLTGDTYDARAALSMGLVSAVVPAGGLVAEAHALAARIVANPPRTLRLTKRLLREGQQQRLQDILDYHSTVEQAAQTAARAGVKTLMLTHYVPPLMPGQEDAWRDLARPHFAGEIVLGDDLTKVTVAEG